MSVSKNEMIRFFLFLLEILHECEARGRNHTKRAVAQKVMVLFYF